MIVQVLCVSVIVGWQVYYASHPKGIWSLHNTAWGGILVPLQVSVSELINRSAHWVS